MKFLYTIAILVWFVCINLPVVCGQSTTDLLCQFDQNKIIQLKIRKAEECINKGDYNGAKSYLNGVLNLDKNNFKAKELLVICNNGAKSVQAVSTTLSSLSKSSISFAASGGNETISLIGHTGSYVVELLPNWCTVQKYTGYFIITCSSNSLNSERKDYFNVSSGGKTIRVNVTQAAKVESSSNNSTTSITTLRTSTQHIYFERQGGNSDPIKVYSNAGSYSISMTPSWCTIKYYTGYFVVVCNPNNSQARSDWFYVSSGDKMLQVVVKQDGYSTPPPPTKTKKKSNPTNLYFGVGAIKPLIFKSDGKTLSNMDVAYSFTIGIVKTVGLYAKINSNLSSVYGDYTPTTLPNTYYGVPRSNSSFNRFGVVGGLMLKINPTIFYAGAGKGYYYHFVRTDLYNYLNNNYINTVELKTLSFNGLETDAGLIINFNKIGLSLGVSSFSFKYYEVNVGLGIRF